MRGWVLVFASATLVAAVFTTSRANTPERLNYWTGYYAMKLNVPVHDVRFTSDLVTCRAVAICACSERGEFGLVVTYSTRPECARLVGRRRPLDELCRQRMAGAGERLVKECMSWYE